MPLMCDAQFPFLLFFLLLVLPFCRAVIPVNIGTCLDPQDLKYSNVSVCITCEAPYDGDFCTRENAKFNDTVKRKVMKYLTRATELQDGKFGPICITPKANMRYTTKLHQKQEIKQVDVYVTGEGFDKQCNVQVKRGKRDFPNCTKTHEWTSGKHKIIGTTCSAEIAQILTKMIAIKCLGPQDSLDKLQICEVKVPVSCKKSWWDLKNGCSKLCQCQDGAECNQTNGECPEGKALTTQTSTTSVETTTQSSTSDEPTTQTSTTVKTTTQTSTTVETTTQSSTTSEELTTQTSTTVETTTQSSTTSEEPTTQTLTAAVEITIYSSAASMEPTTQPPSSTTPETTQPPTSASRSSSPVSSQLTSDAVTSSLTSLKSSLITPEQVDPFTSASMAPKLTQSSSAVSSSPTVLTSRSPSVTSLSSSTSSPSTTLESKQHFTTSTAPATPLIGRSKNQDRDKETKIGGLGNTNPDGNDGETDEDGLLPVLLGVMLVVVVAVALLAAVLAVRHRRKQKHLSEMLFALDNITDPDLENNITGLSIEMASEPFSVTTDSIPVDAFGDHICRMVKVNGFALEFKALPSGILKEVTAADAVNNGTVRKNRFKDISPYDETRVILPMEEGKDCDYINASYINGFKQEMAYIAAQGPLQSTVEDFWCMTWADSCGKIVMLTNLCEEGKKKCEQYWPQEDQSSLTIGQFTVKSVSAVEKAHFVHRVLEVTKTANQGDEDEMPRQIHQFHFTAWPDHGVPCPVALVQFWNHVIHQPSQMTGPMLVHCSAGIGRTGTFIALDMLIQQAELTDKVSVFPTVSLLRNQRVNMVQTLSQYRFLHEVVKEWLASRNTVLVKAELVAGSEWIGQGEVEGQLPAGTREKIAAQFELLDQQRPSPTDEEVLTAKMDQNVQKNRSSEILPVEQYRVCLWTPDDSVNNYINAVFLPSHVSKQRYMVTQLPLEATIQDFFSMVFDWRVNTIIRFMDTPQDESISVYPNEGEQAQLGRISVHTLSKSVVNPGVSLYNMRLCSLPQGEDKEAANEQKEAAEKKETADEEKETADEEKETADEEEDKAGEDDKEEEEDLEQKETAEEKETADEEKETADKEEDKAGEDDKEEEEEEEDLDVRVYCVESAGILTLKNPGEAVALADILMPFITEASQPPVLLQCFNGAGLSCILCAVMMVREAMQVEGRASPFLSTRLIQSARPQAFKTLEEYEFVFRCLLHGAGEISDLGDSANSMQNNSNSQPANETDDTPQNE